MSAQKKALEGLASPDLMTSMIPKAGKIIWWALTGAVVITVGILGLVWVLAPAKVPVWITILHTILLT